MHNFVPQHGFPSTLAWAVAVSPKGVVADDVACRRCAYNLRSLAVRTCCPECGTPVRASLRGDHLTFADPAWLERLALGAAVMRVAAGVGLVGWLGSAFFERVTHLVGFLHMLLFGALVTGMIGAWILSTRDPGGVGEKRSGRSRRLLRVCLVVAVAAAPLTALRDMSDAATIRPLLQIILAAAVYAGLSSVACLHWYIRRLAERLPDHALAMGSLLGCRMWMFGLTLLEVMSPVATGQPGLDLPAVARRFDMWASPIILAMCGGGLLLGMHVRPLARALREAAEASRLLWPQAPRAKRA